MAAGFTRFRPVIMTALAMIIGMVPMAMGMGEGGEQNAPLGRAVIGGLLLATVATLVFVPAVFALLHGRHQAPIRGSPRMSSHETHPPDQMPGPLSVWFRVLIAVVICGVAGAIGYDVVTGIASRVHAADTLKTRAQEMAVPTVTVVHPKRGAMAEEVVLPGNAQAYVATPIYARNSGYLKAWYFDIGAHVKAGQLLAEIETPEIDRQLDQARADLATSQANLELAQTTATRYQNLFKTDSVAKQDLDDRLGDLQAKKAIVDSASFNVRRLEETQRFQKVYAPFDGVITARNVDTGALINAGSNEPGKELFDIASTSRLRVYVNVPQTYSRDVTARSALPD